MKTLKESIFDEEKNISKIDNEVHINAIKRNWKKNEHNDYNSNKDHFGRELNIGDVAYSMQFNYIGVITNIYKENGTTMIAMDNLVNNWREDDDYANNHILIPQSCTKEFLKVITAKK